MALSNSQFQIDSASGSLNSAQCQYKDSGGVIHAFTVSNANLTSLTALQAQIRQVTTAIEAQITLNAGAVDSTITAVLGTATTA